MTFSGTVLIFGLDRGGTQVFGIALAITATVICSIYIVIGSKVTSKADAFPASTIVIIAACVVFGGIAAVKGIVFPVILIGWVSVIALALVSTAIASVTLFAGLRRIDPANASTIYTLEPVITVTLAVIILGETMRMNRNFGDVMILVAVLFVARSEAKTM